MHDLANMILPTLLGASRAVGIDSTHADLVKAADMSSTGMRTEHMLKTVFASALQKM